MSVLWVDDDPLLISAIRPVLRVHHELETAGCLAEARQRLAAKVYDAAILDQSLPDGSGFDLIPLIKERSPTTGVLVLTGDDNYRSVVTAIRRGADDYLVKSDQLAAELLIRIALVSLHASRLDTGLPTIAESLSPGGLRAFLASAERRFLSRALELCDGNLSEAARRLGIGRSTAFAKASELGLRTRREPEISP
ncbi:MAG: response regulator transcription factor [Bdellovibrionales bacterium]|nr:response regulator transcription factor [Bdellovibrionales bacterium]